MKCQCTDCKKTIDQEAFEPAMVVNSADPKNSFVLCKSCLEKRGNGIVACRNCTDLTEVFRLEHKKKPLGFTPCPSCGKDVYTAQLAEEYKTARCKECNTVIFDQEEDVRIINEGTDKEYVACEPCFDSMWDMNAITKCSGCGRWYENGVLHTDPNVEDFTPCPVCGLDIIEGYSKEEAMSRMNERKAKTPVKSLHEAQHRRESAEAMILEVADIVMENRSLQKENSNLRLRIATLEALVAAMRPGGDYAKYEFLANIETQNITHDLHKAAGYVSTARRVDDWEQKLAEFEAGRNNAPASEFTF